MRSDTFASACRTKRDQPVICVGGRAKVFAKVAKGIRLTRGMHASSWSRKASKKHLCFSARAYIFSPKSIHVFHQKHICFLGDARMHASACLGKGVYIEAFSSKKVVCMSTLSMFSKKGTYEVFSAKSLRLTRCRPRSRSRNRRRAW